MTTRTIDSRVITRRQLPPFPPEFVGSLIQLGELLVEDLPRLSRVIADESGRLAASWGDPLSRPPVRDVTAINKKRRASRSLLVHLFQGEVDDHFLSTLRATWLPMLLGRKDLGNQAGAAGLLSYIHGLLSGTLHFEPVENLVPRARIQVALSAAFSRMTDNL